METDLADATACNTSRRNTYRSTKDSSPDELQLGNFMMLVSPIDRWNCWCSICSVVALLGCGGNTNENRLDSKPPARTYREEMPSNTIQRLEGRGIVPSLGVVPDADAAKEIAFTVIEAVFGTEVAKKELPLQAKLVEDLWRIKGNRRPKHNDVIEFGGNVEIHIRKSTGCIEYLQRSK